MKREIGNTVGKTILDGRAVASFQVSRPRFRTGCSRFSQAMSNEVQIWSASFQRCLSACQNLYSHGSLLCLP